MRITSEEEFQIHLDRLLLERSKITQGDRRFVLYTLLNFGKVSQGILFQALSVVLPSKISIDSHIIYVLQNLIGISNGFSNDAYMIVEKLSQVSPVYDSIVSLNRDRYRYLGDTRIEIQAIINDTLRHYLQLAISRGQTSWFRVEPIVPMEQFVEDLK